MEILDTLSQFSPMATVALALVIILQLINNKKTVSGKVEKLGNNHLVHLEQQISDQEVSIKAHIDLHERREMEHGRQVLDMLVRINDTLIRIDSRKGRF